ncbi:MAG: AMP-binding protein [Limnochordales bacterium]|nr:AMP-binding protein [Limnochordales bacterium]
MGGQRDAQSLLDVLRWRARHRPSSAAVGYRQAVLTFADLDRESAALAAALHRLGVQPGDRLALYLQSVPQVLIAQYAAWKLGAIVVPLNIMFKASELAYHLADAGAVGIVCLEEDVPRVLPVAEGAGLKFVISTGADDYSGESSGSAAAPGPRGDSPLSWRELLAAHRGDPPPFHRPGAGDVAYLHYTSGTTGSPKGAMITHGNIMFNARTYVKLGAIASHDKILAAAPLFHITGTIGHLALGCVAGIPIVLLYRFTPERALEAIETWTTTFTIAAITAYIAMLDHLPGRRRRGMEAFRKTFSGGAPVYPAVVERWEQHTGGYIHNVWGMTETTSPGTWTPFGVRAPVDPDTGALSIGKPVPGTQVRIIDADTGQALPPGEVGEIAVRGPHVFAGYWSKPEETRAALQDGWLLTGDLGKMDRDGWVYWIDRKKDLINASGFKVWPREVEDVLHQHPAVREAAVVAAPDAYRGETVKAVVVLHPEHRGRIRAEDIVQFCRERLAAYKYPRVVEFRDELPRNPQGKVLKYLLREDGVRPAAGA